MVPCAAHNAPSVPHQTSLSPRFPLSRAAPGHLPLLKSPEKLHLFRKGMPSSPCTLCNDFCPRFQELVLPPCKPPTSIYVCRCLKFLCTLCLFTLGVFFVWTRRAHPSTGARLQQRNSPIGGTSSHALMRPREIQLTLEQSKGVPTPCTVENQHITFDSPKTELLIPC